MPRLPWDAAQLDALDADGWQTRATKRIDSVLAPYAPPQPMVPEPQQPAIAPTPSPEPAAAPSMSFNLGDWSPWNNTPAVAQQQSAQSGNTPPSFDDPGWFPWSTGKSVAMPTSPRTVDATITTGPRPGQSLQPGESVGSVTLGDGPSASQRGPVPAGTGDIDNSSRESFVRTAYPYMLEAAGGDHNLAELMLAKAISENGDVGKGGGFIGNNFSGIKGVGSAGSFEADTWEDYGQGRVNIRDKFAAYNTPQEGFRAFMGFLHENSRYAPALQRYQQTGDADQLFRDIHAAGYATDPIWTDKVQNIRQHQVAPVVRNRQTADPRQSLNAGAGSPQLAPAPSPQAAAGVPPTSGGPEQAMWSPDGPVEQGGMYQAATGRSGGSGVMYRGFGANMPEEVGNEQAGSSYNDPDAGGTISTPLPPQEPSYNDPTTTGTQIAPLPVNTREVPGNYPESPSGYPETTYTIADGRTEPPTPTGDWQPVETVPMPSQTPYGPPLSEAGPEPVSPYDAEQPWRPTLQIGRPPHGPNTPPAAPNAALDAPVPYGPPLSEAGPEGPRQEPTTWYGRAGQAALDYVIAPALEAMDTANEWLINSPVGNVMPQAMGRELAGSDQISREVREDQQRLEALIRRFRAGDQSVEAEIQALTANLNTRTGGGRAGLLAAGERNPDKGAETAGQVASAALTFGIAPGAGSGVVRNVVAGAMDPVGQGIGLAADAVAPVVRGARAAGRAALQAGGDARVPQMLGSGFIPNAADEMRTSVVPPDVARSMGGGVDLSGSDRYFREAVEATEGARIDADGLHLDLRRFQKPEQAGKPSARTGVYYTPNENLARGYEGETDFGGNQAIRGETLIRRPLIVFGATGLLQNHLDRVIEGGMRPAMRAIAEIDGIADNTALRTSDPAQFEQQLAEALTRHGGEPSAARLLIQSHPDADSLRLASNEHLLAANGRRKGYDAIVVYDDDYSSGYRQPRVMEVFDFREATYPTPDGGYSLRPEFQPQGTGSGLVPQGADLRNAAQGGVIGAASELTSDEELTPQERLARMTIGAGLGVAAGRRAGRGTVQRAGSGMVPERGAASAGARPWASATTGEPITLNVWRGQGAYGGLTPEQQAKFGREYLLGEGFYGAPSPTGAGHFGDPQPHSVKLDNPLVLDGANGASLRSLDIDAVKAAGHDGIVIKSGQWGFGRGQEDLRQVVVFPEAAAGRVQQGHVDTASGVLDKGVRVRIEQVTGRPEYVQQFRADAAAQIGNEGVVTSVDAWGHPSVKIGRKTYKFNRDEVAFLDGSTPQSLGSGFVPEGGGFSFEDFSRAADSPEQKAARDAASQPIRRAGDNQIIREEFGRPWEEVAPVKPGNPDRLGDATRQMVTEGQNFKGTRNRVLPADMADIGSPVKIEPQSMNLNSVGGGLVGAGAGANSDEDLTDQERFERAAMGMVVGGVFMRRPKGQAAAAAADPTMQRMARMMNGPQVPTVANKRGLLERWAQAMTDDRAGLRTLQEAVSAKLGRPLGAGEMVAELTRRNAASIAGQRLAEELRPAIVKVGDDDDYLAQFLIHSHNVDVAREIGQRTYDEAIKNGATPAVASARAMQAANARKFSGDLTIAETQQQLAAIQQRVAGLPDGATRWQNIQDAAQAVWDMNRKTLERKRDAGIISQDLYNELTQRYPRYVRTDIADYFDKGAGGGAATGPKRVGLSDIGVQKISAEGTTKERINPLYSTLDQTYAAEAAIARNESGQAFEELLRIDPTWQATFKEVTPAQGVNVGNPATTVPAGYTLRNGEQFLKVWKNGEARTFVVPPEYAALVSPQTGRVLGDNPAANGWRTLMNVYKSLITSKNPAFSYLVSPVRDLGDYAIQEATESAGKTQGVMGAAKVVGALPGILADYARAVPDVFAGITEGVYKGDLATMMRNGAGMMSRPQRNAKELKQAYEELRRTNGMEIRSMDDMKRAIGNVLTLGAEPVGGRLEQIPRLAAARRAARRGSTPLDQTMRFRDATIDFQRAGEWSRVANELVPFFNVAVQSGAQTVRNFKKNPAAALASVAAVVGTPAILAEVWNHRDEQTARDYEDVPDYLKKTGIVFMIPGVEGRNERGDRLPNYLYIPVGQYGALVQTARENVNNVVNGKATSPDLASVSGWAALAADIGGIFSPIRGDSAASAATSLIPPGLSTAADLAADTDLYRGSKISTDQRDENASALSQASAAGFNAVTGKETRPSQWEHTYRDLGGYAATLATTGSNMLAEATGQRRPKDEDRPIQSAPIVGGLVNRVIRDTGGQRMEDARSENTRVPESIRPILEAAGVRREEVTGVSSKYQGASLTRAEQEKWQTRTNRLITQYVRAARSEPEWSDRTQREQLVKDAISRAKADAAEQTFTFDPATRIEREERRKRRAS